jgi:phospholipid/cholesterol/gamma-HCH transport system substrate-binding protein
MQKQQRNEMIVGLVFFSAMVFLLIYTVVLSGLFKGPQKTFLVSFPKIYGLKKGDQVRVEGLDKGEVVSLGLELRANGEERVLAQIKIATEVEIYRQGSEVKVTPFSPLGGRVVEITRGYESPRGRYLSLEEGEKQSKQENREFTPEEWKIKGTAEGELLQTLNTLVEENSPGISRIVSNLALVSDRLTQKDNVIGALINDPDTGSLISDMADELGRSARALHRILDRIDHGEGIAGELVAKKSDLHDNLNSAARHASGSLEEANLMLVNANAGKSALGVLVSDDPIVSGNARAIVRDISMVTSDVAAGQGSLGKFVKDPRFYDGAASTAENLGIITSNIITSKSAVGVLLNDENTGGAVKNTVDHLNSITKAVDEGQGALGLVVKNELFQRRIQHIFNEVERLTVEFRDSVEDLREQAPVNAFLGAVFAAF